MILRFVAKSIVFLGTVVYVDVFEVNWWGRLVLLRARIFQFLVSCSGLDILRVWSVCVPWFLWNSLLLLVPAKYDITNSSSDYSNCNYDFSLIVLFKENHTHKNKEETPADNSIQEIEI